MSYGDTRAFVSDAYNGPWLAELLVSCVRFQDCGAATLSSALGVFDESSERIEMPNRAFSRMTVAVGIWHDVLASIRRLDVSSHCRRTGPADPDLPQVEAEWPTRLLFRNVM